MKNSILETVFFLHYDDPSEGDPPAGDPPADEPKLTQAQVDQIVQKRTEQARRSQRATLEQLEEIQKTSKMTEEQNEKLEEQIQSLRKQTLSAEEIAKRERKKADDEYQSKLTDAQKNAQTWEQRHNSLKVNHEISLAAQKHGVLGAAVPMLESFLSSKVTVEPKKNDNEEISGFTTVVQFDDLSADGEPIQTSLSVDETVKRMKELPDQYGHLFAATTSGGLGGSNGQGGGSHGGYRKGMSTEEYARLRKENPSALYSEKT